MRRTRSCAHARAALSLSRPGPRMRMSTPRLRRPAATRRSRSLLSPPVLTRTRRAGGSTQRVASSARRCERRTMSWVETELREQPAALARFLAAEEATARMLARELGDVEYVFIASRGSSSNAARYAQYLFGTVNRLPVAFATPSLYTLYDAPPRLAGAFAIAISQSGASPDVVAVLTEARRQGRPTLAITNDPLSPLGRAAEWVLPLHAGEERAVAATKTYLSSLAAIALLSATFDADSDRMSELLAVPDWIAAQVERSLADAEELDRYRDTDGGSVIARGVNLGTAFEIALKIRELSGAPFEPFSSADLLH